MSDDFPPLVFAAVLASALAHAAWNAFIRGARDPLLHTAAIVAWSGVFAVPVLVTVGPPRADSLPWLAGSNLVHMVYYLALAMAYRHGTLSRTYPIIRGAAPLLVALVGPVLFAEALPVTGWLGIALVSAGILALAWRRNSPQSGAAIAWALLCALSIATYSVLDAKGVRQAVDVASYGALMYCAEAVILLAGLVLAGRGAALRDYLVGHWKATAAGGALAASAYTVALWAMSVAPVAMVVAVRETSVLFAALIGVIFLGERLNSRQWLGAATVVVGTMLIRS